jgi:hypothetical protein
MAKFKVGDTVITKYNEWPYREKQLGRIIEMKKYGHRYEYMMHQYLGDKGRVYSANELDIYINNIDDLL